MKKLFLFAFILLSVCAGKVMAQNIQLHYDLGRALSIWIIQTKECHLLIGKSAVN